MVRGLTDSAIKDMKAGDTRCEIPYPGCAGLYLVLQPRSTVAAIQPHAKMRWPISKRSGRTVADNFLKKLSKKNQALEEVFCRMTSLIVSRPAQSLYRRNVRGR